MNCNICYNATIQYNRSYNFHYPNQFPFIKTCVLSFLSNHQFFKQLTSNLSTQTFCSSLVAGKPIFMNLAMFGNNYFVTFPERKHSKNKIPGGWPSSICLAFSKSEMVNKMAVVCIRSIKIQNFPHIPCWLITFSSNHTDQKSEIQRVTNENNRLGKGLSKRNWVRKYINNQPPKVTDQDLSSKQLTHQMNSDNWLISASTARRFALVSWVKTPALEICLRPTLDI